MHVNIELCLIPIGAEGSLAPAIARCQLIFLSAGLQPQLNPFGTCVEGDWDVVMSAVRQCHEAVHAMGVARIFSSLKVGTRTDRAQTLQDKLESVQNILNQ